LTDDHDHERLANLEERSMDATQMTAHEAALTELAHSRGIADPEELRDRLRPEGRERTARLLVEEPPAGFGQALDSVLDLAEEEKVRLARAFVETFLPIRR
jgi:beta-phosphoglucomutase-like phosphatase (HAD superfamily)